MELIKNGRKLDLKKWREMEGNLLFTPMFSQKASFLYSFILFVQYSHSVYVQLLVSILKKKLIIVHLSSFCTRTDYAKNEFNSHLSFFILIFQLSSVIHSSFLLFILTLTGCVTQHNNFSVPVNGGMIERVANRID
jgi:hypothetical protein